MNNKEVAIVTGGTRGIGKAIAEMLLKEGFNVAICSRSAAEGKNAVATLSESKSDKNESGTVFYRVVDIGQRDQVNTFVREVIEKFGRLDILINNAATTIRKQFDDMTDEEIQSIVQTNLMGTIWCTKDSLPYLLKSSRHTIINVSSELDHIPLAGLSVYCATKAGMVSFTKVLAMEYAPANLRVLGIRPRHVDTWLRKKFRPEEPVRYKPEHIGEWVRQLLFERTCDDSGCFYSFPEPKK